MRVSSSSVLTLVEDARAEFDWVVSVKTGRGESKEVAVVKECVVMWVDGEGESILVEDVLAPT